MTQVTYSQQRYLAKLAKESDDDTVVANNHQPINSRQWQDRACELGNENKRLLNLLESYRYMVSVCALPQNYKQLEVSDRRWTEACERIASDIIPQPRDSRRDNPN